MVGIQNNEIVTNSLEAVCSAEKKNLISKDYNLATIFIKIEGKNGKYNCT